MGGKTFHLWRVGHVSQGSLSGSTIRTLLHGKINTQNWQVINLGDVGFLLCFRVVSGDYGKPCLCLLKSVDGFGWISKTPWDSPTIIKVHHFREHYFSFFQAPNKQIWAWKRIILTHHPPFGDHSFFVWFTSFSIRIVVESPMQIWVRKVINGRRPQARYIHSGQIIATSPEFSPQIVV